MYYNYSVHVCTDFNVAYPQHNQCHTKCIIGLRLNILYIIIFIDHSIQTSQSNPIPVVTPSSDPSAQNVSSLQSSLLGKLQRIVSFFSSHDKLSEKSSSHKAIGAWLTHRPNTDSKQAATITLQCCLPMLAIATELGSVDLASTKNKLYAANRKL